MSNFSKRTKRASEELEYDAANGANAFDFISWLHEVTVLGYSRDITIDRCQQQLLEYLYGSGTKPEEAIKRIEEVLRRVDAINENPA